MQKGDKRGQVAIWVIVALVVASGILLYFAFTRLPSLMSKEMFEPQQFIEKCTTQTVNEAADKMLPQGGFLEPTNFKVYKDTKIAYLCLHSGYFKPCVNQHPMFINDMKNEIKTYIQPKIEACFESMKKEITNRQGTIELGDLSIDVSAAPNTIFVDIKRKTTITEGGSTQTFEGFNVKVMNPLYDLGNIAITAADNEAKYCYFEYLGYMLLYPRWDIREFRMSDFTKIYTIKDKNSGKLINIATRSCAMPPGMGI